MSKKKSNNVPLIRGLIIGAVVVLGVAVIGYGLLYSSGVTQGEFVAGEHYQVLENPPRRHPDANPEVTEFFSYGCVHCKNFDPLINEWLITKPDNVNFARVPVAFSPQWLILAQTYYALEELNILEQNHERIFRRIHNTRNMFGSAEEAADYIDGNGATAAEFLAAFNGAEVRRKLREADAAQRRVGIAAVPTLVVNGKYSISMDVGRKVALEVVDHLIAADQNQGDTASDTTTEGG